MTRISYTRQQYDRVQALVSEGRSLTQIEAATGVSRSSVFRIRQGTQGPPADDLILDAPPGPLRELLEAEQASTGLSPDELTVLSYNNDPFRLDNPARHRDARWLASTLEGLGFEVGNGSRTIHLRGIHYMILGQVKPNGRPYHNTYNEWGWLKSAAKAARWLGYIPFGQVTDQRNAEPLVRTASRPEPVFSLSAGAQTWYDSGEGGRFGLPGASAYEPRVRVSGFEGTQRWRVAMVGEKSSLEPVLGPLARQYDTDLYLPTGEISDTLVHRMVTEARTDGRPLAVLYFADCDPAGWQMGVSVARKLLAFSALLGGFEYELHRVALTPGQVRELGLPSTPLKETEGRAAKWIAATGLEQTEVDALASLQPAVLAGIAREALDRFYDKTLAARVSAARREWLEEAQQAAEDELADELAEFRASAPAKVEQMEALAQELNSAFDPGALDSIELPEIEIPQVSEGVSVGAARAEDSGTLLVSSEWSFAGQVRALKESLSYAGDSLPGEEDGE